MKSTTLPAPIAQQTRGNGAVQPWMGESDRASMIRVTPTDSVVEPAGVTCCGFAGDRGFVVPELNAHALRKIHAELPSSCCEGVSTNRTCEIGLTEETGRPYHSVAYLLEECSREEDAAAC